MLRAVILSDSRTGLSLRPRAHSPPRGGGGSIPAAHSEPASSTFFNLHFSQHRISLRDSIFEVVDKVRAWSGGWGGGETPLAGPTGGLLSRWRPKLFPGGRNERPWPRTYDEHAIRCWLTPERSSHVDDCVHTEALQLLGHYNYNFIFLDQFFERLIPKSISLITFLLTLFFISESIPSNDP